jgi:hypothetical protein
MQAVEDCLVLLAEKRWRVDTGHLAFRNSTQAGVGAVLRRKASAGPLRVPAAPIEQHNPRASARRSECGAQQKSRLFDSPKGFERAGPALCV